MRKLTNILSGVTASVLFAVSIVMMITQSGTNFLTLSILIMIASILCIAFSTLGFFLKNKVFSIFATFFVVILFVLFLPIRLYALGIESFFIVAFFASELPISSLISFALILITISTIAMQFKLESSFKDGSKFLYKIYNNLKDKFEKIFTSPVLLKKNIQLSSAFSVFVSGLVLVIISYNLGLSASYTTVLAVDDKAVYIEGNRAYSRDFNLSRNRAYIINDQNDEFMYYFEGNKVFESMPEEDSNLRVFTKNVDNVFEAKSLYLYNLFAIFINIAVLILTIFAFFISKKRILVPLLMLNFLQFLYWVPFKFILGYPIITFHLGFLIFILLFINLKSIFKTEFVNFTIKIFASVFILLLFSFDVSFGDMIETGISWMQVGANGAVFSEMIKNMVQGFAGVLNSVSWVFVALVISFVLLLIKKDLLQGVFIFFTLFFIEYMGIWTEAMETMSLVVFSTFLALLLGLPIGIFAAFNKGINGFITPILDFMQTMPAFVYLIPAVAFFGLGEGPAVFATLIFAIPPCIRLTSLGISQIDSELIEAADSFGSTRMQKLIKVQIPNAMPTIMAGINQTIMLSLSMVVIASMVGTGGLGKIVFQAVNQLQLGSGFEGGIAVVIIAIILDKITQSIKQ